jgi:hypothetical protein
MNYKPDEKEWMAYLYGESEGEDKVKIDQYLLENAEARNELEKFKRLRSMMSSVEDKEVIAPPIFVGETRQRFLWNTPYFNTIVSIAASLLLIILVGKLTGTRIHVSNNEFKLSFGEVKEQTVSPGVVEKILPQGLTADQVQAMINNSLNQNTAAMQVSLKESQEKMNTSIRQNLALNSGKLDQLMREAAMASQEQIRQYVAGIQTQNMNQVKDYFQLTSSEQKKYIENILVDFSQYLQQQRSDDLQLVQTRLQSLEQNTNIFKQETEQILTSIISTVETGQKTTEIKN